MILFIRLKTDFPWGKSTNKTSFLQFQALLKSLNETKSSSEEISQALSQSKKLQSELSSEIQMYLPLGQFAASSYFAIQSLSRVNPLYQFSIPAFIRLFQANLESSSEVRKIKCFVLKNIILRSYQTNLLNFIRSTIMNNMDQINIITCVYTYVMPSPIMTCVPNLLKTPKIKLH